MSDGLVIRVDGVPIAVGQRWRPKIGSVGDLVVVVEVKQVPGVWSRVIYRRALDNSRWSLTGPEFLRGFAQVSDPRDGTQSQRAALGVFGALASEPLTREQVVAGLNGETADEAEILTTAKGRAELLAEARAEREARERIEWLEWREEFEG